MGGLDESNKASTKFTLASRVRRWGGRIVTTSREEMQVVAALGVREEIDLFARVSGE